MPAEGKLLGKRVDYPKNYCPDILVTVPRTINREIYGITDPGSLFCGFDSWHAYEVSFLLSNGMPVAGILKIVYSSSSAFIVESKSLKLYLGSFNMTVMGDTRDHAINQFVETIKKDLSNLLSIQVEACFYTTTTTSGQPFDFSDYKILEEEIDIQKIQFSIYQEHPVFLSENTQKSGELKVGSHLLKSNCKITNQPDWGSIYIHLKSNILPAPASLLKYIVSLRNENHFHEEICEMTFKRLNDLFQPEILMVSCLYTRRGGIDICPCRANQPVFLPSYLPQANQFTQRGFRQ